MPALESIVIEGFKSIRNADIELQPLNVLIGANGSGKSNFVNVFRFLHEIIAGNLKVFVGRSGGADGFLYFGRKTTERMHLRVNFVAIDSQANAYSCTLIPTTDDELVFLEEFVYFHDRNRYSGPYQHRLGGGYAETQLQQEVRHGGVAAYVRDAMQSWRIYHFHDTGDSAKVKQTGDIHDNRFLRSDAGNLAAYLYLLRETKAAHYRKIVGAIRLIAPFFADFALRPSPLNPDRIRLEWTEKGSDMLFGTSALSDGTLRFMALATLLLQPSDTLPSTILLDEPELGLHPYAIVVLAGLLRSASQQTQVIVSTQSVTLVNQFAPEDVVVVEKEDGQSVFRRFSATEIDTWLEEYSLGELWEKNLLGGRPSA